MAILVTIKPALLKGDKIPAYADFLVPGFDIF
jgi:hypothetical protein